MTTETQSLITGFHHVAFRVTDFEAALKFFVDGLGLKVCKSWTMKKTGKRAAMISAGGNSFVEIFGSGLEEDSYDDKGMYHFALRTDDVEAAHQLALDHGATEDMAPTLVTINMDQGPTDVKISFVQSPVGIIIEFFENGGVED